jgi:predicted RNA-binding protein with TRAM domain
MGGGFREPPVKVGEEYDVQITDIAAKGDGIAKIEGFIIFVPGTTKGDSCRIRVKEVARRFAVAEKVGDAGSAPAAGEPAEEEMPVEEEETQ